MDRFAELTAFCAVATHAGFSPAARQLGLATSSVTRLVDALEARLGAPLLNRSTRSVTLTDAGRTYQEHALRILDDLQAADLAAVPAGGEPQGRLRIAAPVTFAILHIAPLIPALQAAFPRLVLDLVLSDAMGNLVDDGIDVAIRIGTADDYPNLVARRLASHERIICASPAYLAAHGTPAAPRDLLQHNCLQFNYGDHRGRWRLLRDGDIEDLQVRGTLQANNAEVLRQAALNGCGIVLLADWLVHDDLRHGTLVQLLPAYRANPASMDVALVALYQPSRRGSRNVTAFLDLLGAHLGQPALPADGNCRPDTAAVVRAASA